MLTLESPMTTHPFPAIRGVRMTRMEEQVLGPFQLDAPTAHELIDSNVGVFVGCCPKVELIIARLERLVAVDYPSRWLIVSSSDELHAWHYRHFTELRGATPAKREPGVWSQGSVTFTTPEGLDSYLTTREGPEPIAAILLIDPLCHVHLYRGYGPYFRGNHDRPQLIANFRGALQAEGTPAPLLLLTNCLAKSVNTDAIRSPYSLDGWWFVDGARLTMGKRE